MIAAVAVIAVVTVIAVVAVVAAFVHADEREREDPVTSPGPAPLSRKEAMYA